MGGDEDKRHQRGKGEGGNGIQSSTVSVVSEQVQSREIMVTEKGARHMLICKKWQGGQWTSTRIKKLLSSGFGRIGMVLWN